MVLRIGTRGSNLALAQSQWVKKEVEIRHPHVQIQLVRIKTTGDKILDSPLSQIGGKGLFVKEIEEALLDRNVDLAVHSMKDIPAEVPDGLELAIFPEREDPRDALVSVRYGSLEDLRLGAVVGTSSLRRTSQLLHMRPDLQVVTLRGNVDTRLRKLESGELDGIILAVAGLRRLGFPERITQTLSPGQLLPAIGQGSLGLEIRRDDEGTRGLLGFLNHDATALTVKAERAFLKELEGGCQVPVAAHCRLDGDQLHMDGLVAELDGTRIFRDGIRGGKDQPEVLGVELARRLLHRGAKEVLDRIYGRQ